MDGHVIKALAFDVFGTVCDWRTTLSRECARIAGRGHSNVDWQTFAEEWRRGYKPAIDDVRSGKRPWATVDALHAGILEEILGKFEILDMSDHQKREMTLVWHRLDSWPDARKGLERLRRRFVTTTLSNGNISLLVELSRNSDLRFDCIISAEHVKKYKVDPEPYQAAAEFLDLELDEVALVSAHPEDLAGAKRAGLRTVHVPRPAEWRLPPARTAVSDRYDIVSTDFLELANRLQCP